VSSTVLANLSSRNGMGRTLYAIRIKGGCWCKNCKD